MGQNNSKGDSKTSVPEYRPNFEVIRVIDDPNYGRVKLIREAKTHQQMILKEFIFDTKQAFEEELKFFKERAAFDHPHIVQVIGYNATQNQNLCSSLFKVSVFIEILSKELQTAVRERKRSKAAYSEGDLLIIAENVIAALYHLQTKNMAHGDIRPVNIFVSGQTYKVTDPKLEIDKNANALVKAIISNQETLLSPQLLAKIPTKKFEITEDRYKADVFSLGATLLNVATLKNSEELYDYQHGTINQDLLRERLAEVKAQYSPFTYQLISDMLRIDEHERPDFVDLRDRLLPHHEAINTKQDLPFTHHNLDTFGGAPAAQARQGEKVKKAAVQLIDEDRHDSHHDHHHEEERLPSFASETHHTANFAQPQRIEPAFHHPAVFTTEHHAPAAVTHHEHHEHHVEPPQFKSHLDTDDLEAKIRAALQRSQDTYKQVQESESHFGTYQPPAHTTYQPHTTTFQSTTVNQRPLVSFGASGDFAPTQFHHEDLHVPQPHVVERSYEVHSIGEHNVKAPRQPTWEVEYNRDITAGEHKVNAPRQPGWEVEYNRDITAEHKVNAPRQPGWDVEISREAGGERKVNAPRQPGWDEEQVKKSFVPQHHVDVPATRTSGFIHTDVPATRTSGFIHTDVPATRTSGFIHTDVPATRTSGFIHTSEAHAVPAKVEEHHYIPTTTPATYDISYTGYTYTPSGGYATQNLGLLENLKRTSEATLAHQQDLHRKSDTQSFGQTGSHHQEVVVKSSPEHHAYESIHTYQPTTTYNIGGTTLGTTGLRASGEHHLRSSPGVVGTDDVRKVGEVGGNSALNTAAFTYTSFNLPKAAADDVMAFTPQTYTPQTYTVEHTAPHTTTNEHTTTYNFTTGTLGQYGHHEPTTTYNFGTDQYKIGGTQDYHFTTPAAYTVHGGETEKVVKSYHIAGETPQSHGVAYSPTLPSVTPKHHVTNIQTTDFARGDTVTYGTHTPTHAYGNLPGADRPGGILGEVSSAVSKYTFTTVEEGGQHQFGDSPARFV